MEKLCDAQTGTQIYIKTGLSLILDHRYNLELANCIFTDPVFDKSLSQFDIRILKYYGQMESFYRNIQMPAHCAV
jgi:hypothetical protein